MAFVSSLEVHKIADDCVHHHGLGVVSGLEVHKAADDFVHHHGLGVFSGWRSTRPLTIVYIIMALVSSLAGGLQSRR